MGGNTGPPPINVNPNDPNSVPNVSQQYNTKTGVNNQQGTAVGQNVGPYGALSYTTSINPTTGLPQLTANQSYSPVEQAIFSMMAGGQLGQGGTALQTIANTFGQYTQDPNLVNKAQGIVDQNTSPMNASWERFMQPQRDQLRTSLLNQGLTEGSPAYQQQMDMLTQQQMLTKGSWLAQFQPQAFQEATQNYQLPLMNVSQMLSGVQPVNLNNLFNNTPGMNINPIDYAQQAETAQTEGMKQAEMKNAWMNNLFSGLGGGAVKLGAAPTDSIFGAAIGA